MFDWIFNLLCLHGTSMTTCTCTHSLSLLVRNVTEMYTGQLLLNKFIKHTLVSYITTQHTQKFYNFTNNFTKSISCENCCHFKESKFEVTKVHLYMYSVHDASYYIHVHVYIYTGQLHNRNSHFSHGSTAIHRCRDFLSVKISLSRFKYSMQHASSQDPDSIVYIVGL